MQNTVDKKGTYQPDVNRTAAIQAGKTKPIQIPQQDMLGSKMESY